MGLITIPEYYARFIDPKVDLDKTPKVCCPFHQEDTPSFSYSPEKGVWRCFGACHFGGDVIAMHQKHYKLRNRAEAEKSLYRLLGYRDPVQAMTHEPPRVNESLARVQTAYANAIRVATNPDAWEELDYIMSQYPIDATLLEAFYDRRAAR